MVMGDGGMVGVRRTREKAADSGMAGGRTVRGMWQRQRGTPDESLSSSQGRDPNTIAEYVGLYLSVVADMCKSIFFTVTLFAPV